MMYIIYVKNIIDLLMWYFSLNQKDFILFFFFFRKEAQLDEEGQFLVRIIYDDSKTYDLVAAASKVLSK